MAAWGSPSLADRCSKRFRKSRRERAHRDMNGFLPDLSENGNVKRVVLSGDPALKIVEYARGEDAGLMVMPTHGYGPFRRFLLGSVTAKVLHDAECPVLTGVHVPSTPAMQDFGMGHVVCAAGLGPNTGRVLDWADRFAKEFGSRVTVVHITPALESSLSDAVDPRWQVDLTRQARNQIERLQIANGTTPEILIDSGKRRTPCRMLGCREP